MAQTNVASGPMYKTNFAFAVMLIGMVGYFIYWGLGYTNHNHTTMFLLATFFGVFMAFNIGGNDVANSFGTSVGAGTLTIPQALIVAAVFEVSGAVIAGGEVSLADGTHAVRLCYVVRTVGCRFMAIVCHEKRVAGIHYTRNYRRYRR